MSQLNIKDQNKGTRPLAVGAWRGLTFVAIIWAIAGAFYLLQLAEPWAFDRVLRSDLIPQWIVTRSVPATDCSVVTQKVPQPTPDAQELKRARSAAFNLGLALGATTMLRNISLPDSEKNRELRSTLALMLGVPVPETPPVESFANTLSEFQTYVLADQQCIGALLARKYSPEDDALYRFGAFAGYNLVRIKMPTLDAIFVPQLRQFGKSAGLPEEVRDSFIDTRVDVRTALSRVNAYLQTELPSKQR
jgi:hypothetical protein